VAGVDLPWKGRRRRRRLGCVLRSRCCGPAGRCRALYATVLTRALGRHAAAADAPAVTVVGGTGGGWGEAARAGQLSSGEPHPGTSGRFWAVARYQQILTAGLSKPYPSVTLASHTMPI
jgi:hypothetical protein